VFIATGRLQAMNKPAKETDQPSRPSRLITVLAGSLFLLPLLASFILAFLGGGSYADSSGGPADRRWSVMALTVAGLLFLTNVLALAFLIWRRPVIWSIAAMLHLLTLVGFCTLIPAGFAMLTELQNSGKDYTGLGGVGCFIFGIALPTVIGLLNLGAGSCLLALRRRRLSDSSPPA